MKKGIKGSERSRMIARERKRQRTSGERVESHKTRDEEGGGELKRREVGGGPE